MAHPDNYTMKKRTGVDAAAQLVHRFMETLHPNRMDGMSETAFPPPPGYIALRICMFTGQLATEETQHVALEWFRPATEPVEKSDVYRKVAIDTRTGHPALADCPDELIRQKTYVALDERFAAWAKQSGLELPPVAMLDAPSLPGQAPPLRIAINEPPDGETLLPDPETPADLSTIPLHATVTRARPQVVWYVDGKPYEVVDYPYSTRWKLTPGHHTFQVKLPYAPVASSKVRVTVQ
ncbi:MAG: hypothetical protein HYX75_08735 [Acidobacteria bacterium]|nr:hypothetical protein [Acidobacteriota bacterium]